MSKTNSGLQIIPLGQVDSKEELLNGIGNVFYLADRKDVDRLKNILLNYPIYATLIEQRRDKTYYMLYYITNNIPVRLIVYEHVSRTIFAYVTSSNNPTTEPRELINNIANNLHIKIPASLGFYGWL